MATNSNYFSLREALAIAFRHRRALLLSMIVPPILALGLAFLSPKYFQADSKILVKAGSEFVPENTDPSRNVAGPQLTMQEAVDSEIEILTSDDLISTVISQVGLYKVFPDMDPDSFKSRAQAPTIDVFSRKFATLLHIQPLKAPTQERAVEQFQKQLIIEPIRLANVLSVSFQDETPGVATEVLQRLLDGYIQRHIEAFSSTRSQLLALQLQQNLQALQAAQQERAALRTSDGVYSVDLQRTALIAQRDNAVAQLATSESKQRQDQKLVAFLQTRLRKLPSSGAVQTTSDSTGRGAAMTQLLALKQQELELSQKYSPQSSLVTDVEAAIKATQKFISGSADAPPPVGDALKLQEVNTEGELSTLNPMIQDLKTLIANTTQQLRQLEADAIKLYELDLRISNFEQKNSTLRDALAEARISESLDRGQISSVSVIELPHLEVRAVKPKKLLFLAAGVIGGLMACGFTILSLLTFGNTIVTVESVERIVGLPVLASVPLMRARSGSAR